MGQVPQYPTAGGATGVLLGNVVQEAQLSQRGRAMLSGTPYFAKLLKVTEAI